MIDRLRKTSKKLLTDREVDLVIGYGKNPDASISPLFIVQPEDTDNLVWDKSCYNNLAVYLTKDFVKKTKR